jgi:hypothetical protein
MVALNHDRTKVVPPEALEARWMVQEGEVANYLKEAKKQPRMQALMQEQEADRLKAEEKSAERLAAETARAKRRGY